MGFRGLGNRLRILTLNSKGVVVLALGFRDSAFKVLGLGSIGFGVAGVESGHA